MQASITTQLSGNNLQVVCTLPDFSPLPTGAVFLYANTGTNTLGAYMGVANVNELSSFQVWTGTPIPIFANAYVLHTQAVINIQTALPSEQAAAVSTVSSLLLNNLEILKLQYLSTYNVTQIYPL